MEIDFSITAQQLEHIDVSDDLRSQVADLVKSDLWRNIVELIFKPHLRHIVNVARNAQADHRYHQGFDAGFCHAISLLTTTYSRPKSAYTAVPYISETDLRPKHRSVA